LRNTCLLVNGELFDEYVIKNHSLLREKLQSKGYQIINEFSCAGFNTNSFLKLFGGLNKGRPNVEDLKHAEEFAQNLKQQIKKKEKMQSIITVDHDEYNN